MRLGPQDTIDTTERSKGRWTLETDSIEWAKRPSFLFYFGIFRVSGLVAVLFVHFIFYPLLWVRQVLSGPLRFFICYKGLLELKAKEALHYLRIPYSLFFIIFLCFGAFSLAYAPDF